MAFVGSELGSCFAVPFTSTACIIVSGDGVNVCGHALLYADGYYFHVTGVYDRPRYMTEDGYRQYLSDSGKTELGRYRRHLSLPSSAYTKLMRLMSERWLWGVLPNNCIVFVEEVLQAGGATNFGLYSNCPVLQVNKDRWEQMLYEMRRNATEAALIGYFVNRPPPYRRSVRPGVIPRLPSQR